MYGGAVASNDKNFYLFANENLKKFSSFPFLKYLKQCLIFLILKIFSINLIYRYTFFKFLKKAHLKKNLFILSIVYPSLRFKKQSLPRYYSTKISNLSIKMIYMQLKEKNFNKNHLAKKAIIYIIKNFYLRKKLKVLLF